MMYFFKALFPCCTGNTNYFDTHETRDITVTKDTTLERQIELIKRDLERKYNKVGMPDIENISTPPRKR